MYYFSIPINFLFVCKYIDIARSTDRHWFAHFIFNRLSLMEFSSFLMLMRDGDVWTVCS